MQSADFQKFCNIQNTLEKNLFKSLKSKKTQTKQHKKVLRNKIQIFRAKLERRKWKKEVEEAKV